MDIQKKLEKLGIISTRKLDNESIRIVAYNVTEALTKTFPIIYDEYNNILIRLLNCSMYVSQVITPISRVNYIYENNSIYFDEEVNLNKIDEQMVHACIHYLQDDREVNGKLNKIGLCNFDEFSIYALGLNEAAVQYMAAKCVGNTITTIERYGVRLKTISPNHYPFLTNLLEQLVYLLGEDLLIKGTLNIDKKIEDEILNTFEGNTKKITGRFDEILEINNTLNNEIDLEKIQILKEGLINIYLETQNMMLSTYFDKICTKLNTIQEIDFYNDKAIYYKDLMGVLIQDRFSTDGFYEKYIEELNAKLTKRLMAISKEESKNTLSIIRSDRIMQFIRKLVSYFQYKKIT